MKYVEGLCSIITPCYNGEEHIETCFSSVLSQTYKSIEFIFIDDGSEDGSFQVAQKWEMMFKEKGIKFLCLQKENGGAASAVSVALKYMSGEFFEVFDVDDYIYPKNIEAKVDYLREHPDVGFVRNDGEIYNVESNVVVSSFTNDDSDRQERNIFHDLLFGKTYNWAGAYLIRTHFFVECNAGIDIYISRFGQNMQLLLPIAEKTICGFVPERLTRYNEYQNSVSHSNEYEKNIKMLDGYKDIRFQVLGRLNRLSDALENMIEQFYIRKKLELAYRFKRKNDVDLLYKSIQRKTLRDKLLYIRSKCKIADDLFMLIIKIRKLQ